MVARACRRTPRAGFIHDSGRRAMSSLQSLKQVLTDNSGQLSRGLKLNEREVELNRRSAQLDARESRLILWEADLSRREQRGSRGLSWEEIGISKRDLTHLGIMDKTPLNVLELGFKSIFRKMAFEHHPDHNGDANMFRRARDAYDRVMGILDRLSFTIY